ncbi:CaiB/BaiF CoA-transferase family protein [Telmatospirillum sp. J64-1]|uniref:CaiB/BaiF CoA transferase family protein n=1 Tax=Telmatospirillum sp. J64-1 TaxID=2502183 RepID=UPI00115CA15A|nr:CaiB/BaiF CoA-transferase family protein [Telmatospirillum sp. J64-1]
MTGALEGIRILDLTRVLAGPTCTQVLGDLGADVIKVERPGAGDDTRKWGPPFLKDREGKDTKESAYYLSANRNKRSVAIDITTPEGQDLILRLLEGCDVLVENYKLGNLARYGLGFEQLHARFPRLVYCSITGFGQTGPYAPRAGYDFLAQGMGGMMSLTGDPEGEPVKAGIGNADLLTGMYACVSILAALRHRDRTGQGQHIDCALLDSQVAWMTYEAENYLISGEEPKRRGNAHPNIVPYEVFPAADGFLILAVGNDSQYQKFCAFAGRPDLAEDERYATNTARVKNRATLIPELRSVIARHPRRHWLDGLEKLGVPAGPVNTLPEAFENPQVKARGMRIEMPHALTDKPVPLVASPIKMSATPPGYRHAPPYLGQHTEEILSDLLGLSAEEIARLREKGVV